MRNWSVPGFSTYALLCLLVIVNFFEFGFFGRMICKAFVATTSNPKMMASRKSLLRRYQPLLRRLQPPLILVLLVLVLLIATVFSTQSCTLQTTSNDRGSVENKLATAPSRQEDYKGPQTTWKAWRHRFPCYPGEPKWNTVRTQHMPADTGLLFTREMKTGSSTVAGIFLRIAHRKGESMLPDKKSCRMRIDHSSARDMEYGQRDKKKSFLSSLLRDPTKRAISHYFHFIVSGKKENPTDANFIGFFQEKSEMWSNYYTKDLTMRDDDDLQDESQHPAIVANILSQYDFIAITERLDESLVVMKLLLGLDMEDILYMSAKKHGSFTSGPQVDSCIYITPPFLTQGMNDFFASDYWQDYIRADQLLYDAANKSLDNTIDALGRKMVQGELVAFRKALEYTQAQCEERTIYRCNSKGENVGGGSTCYLWDIGCGFNCLNEISVDRDVLGA